MATLKEFEEALRENGMQMALAILERLRERDRATRVVKPGRRIVGKKMTPELAREILELHGACYGVNSTLGEGSTFWFELLGESDTLSPTQI